MGEIGASQNTRSSVSPHKTSMKKKHYILKGKMNDYIAYSGTN